MISEFSKLTRIIGALVNAVILFSFQKYQMILRTPMIS